MQSRTYGRSQQGPGRIAQIHEIVPDVRQKLPYRTESALPVCLMYASGEGVTMKESIRKILCCVCRNPMVLTASGSGEEKRWRCNTPGCVIYDYALRKNRYLLQ